MAVSDDIILDYCPVCMVLFPVNSFVPASEKCTLCGGEMITDYYPVS